MQPSDGERLDEALRSSVGFYANYLRESPDVSVVREWLEGEVGPALLDEFEVGYAPSAWMSLRVTLEAEGFGPDELQAAGLIHRSHRSDQLYDHFRSRIMFPVRDIAGALQGFAGLATAPGPSWPQWLTSPDGPKFRRGRALFGIDRARDAIAAAERVVVLRDCLEVLRRRREGQAETVAIIRSNLTAEHRAVLAPLGARVDSPPRVRRRRGGGRGP